MSAARHRRVTELFLGACERAGAARDVWLAQECGADAALRREVEELLAVDADGVPILEGPALVAAAAPPEGGPALDLAPLAERRYEVRGELARGGMGAILRVNDPALRRELAMKVSLSQLGEARGAGSSGSAGLARFVAEAQITAQLDHPGIVPVHELGLDPEGRVYFTMKLVQGRELGEVLRHAHAGAQGWTRVRALGILRRVCEAMAYAHDKGVVHRDLKPSNVMVGEYGEVYVMDWGVARAGGAGALAPVTTSRDVGAGDESALHTRQGAIVGSPHAMPPEQARGEPVGPPADVYAVGAMLYRLLAGRRPYEEQGESATASVVLARILRGPPRPLRQLAPEAPAELVAIAERAMAAEPAGRYTSMRALADDLGAYLEGRVVRAHRTGAVAELQKWVARNRLAAAALGATVLAIVAGLAWSRRIEATSRHELDLGADYYRARVVSESAAEPWPATPAQVPVFEDWLRRAEALLARRAEHAGRLRRLEARPSADPSEVERQRALLGYLDALEGGADGTGGVLAAVRARRDFALTIEERSRSGPEVAARWREACAAIAGHPAYAGLALAPQLGLVPLGADPSSGLWEFAHLESGEPARRGADGRLVLQPETGLVLVLLPGGVFAMGSTPRAGQPNHDPHSTQNEWPVHDVTLAPFFLAKHEMTQAQWERCVGRNPSKWRPGADPGLTPLNPVEQVSFHDCERALALLGLVLPTEARWEYACRAASDTPFACPSEDLGLFANLADQSYRNGFTGAFDVDAFTDGFAYHAPVGSLEPNEFGLHDMHGNVMEWTLDCYGSYLNARRPGDGLSLGPQGPDAEWWSPDYRVGRGGPFDFPARYARSSHRVNISPGLINHGLGVRPAREIEAEAGG
ncbi:MAG TPA: bifunctional serine/threonine-protein kinase/formylglycine-generating enzyme family protein [Planctomycetota bacterium]